MNVWRKAFIMERAGFEFFVIEVSANKWAVSISRDMEVVQSQSWFDSQEQAIEFAENWEFVEDDE